MSDWSSKSKSPSSIWKILSKENSNLDKSYFMRSNGSWDIPRLNLALAEHEERISKSKMIKQQNDSQRRFFEQQQIQQLPTQQVVNQRVNPNTVNFARFNFAIILYFIPLMIQLPLMLVVMVDPKMIFEVIPIIFLCNIVMWISIPLMSKSLAKEINKLDR